MNTNMRTISHYTLFCMVFVAVLCLGGVVSAITIAEPKSSMTITGQDGTTCIPGEITLNGTTNYNTDNRVIVEISPAEFAPTSKTAPQNFSGAAATVDVQEGTGMNFWMMAVNTTGWEPGMYLVQATVVGKGVIESEFITLEYCTE
ncbi:MAG: hypothetical protein LBV40_08270 [Methanomicrobiales archaeon]|nr:hypothetical protein [Methanomicrobiales archaeon]